MAESSVEKKLLYLILCSALLHAGLAALLLNLPAAVTPPQAEPLMVDLQDIPPLTPSREMVPPVSRKSDVFRRVPRETAPIGEARRELAPSPPRQGNGYLPSPPRSTQPGWPTARESAPQGSSRDELFRRKEQGGGKEPLNLFPSAARLAAIEESYRRKYGREVTRGEASFLNTDDIMFGSFLRRFENAVYGVWRYPQEAVRLGIEGVTPVRITFNRRGEVVAKELLQSSGSKILDDEVLRTLSVVGGVGSFPKGYDRESFTLIAFFHYGIVGGVQRSLH